MDELSEEYKFKSNALLHMKQTTEQNTTIHISFTEDNRDMYQRLMDLKTKKHINLSSLIRGYIKRGLDNE